MQQHNNAIKNATPRIDCKPPQYHKDNRSTPNNSKLRFKTRPRIRKKLSMKLQINRPKSCRNLSRHKSSHSIIQRRKQIEIDRKNQAIFANINNTKIGIDNKNPYRFNKSLHAATRKHQRKKIEYQNLKIHKNLCLARSVIPNANELQQRWRQQRVIKQRLRKPTQTELMNSIDNEYQYQSSRSISRSKSVGGFSWRKHKKTRSHSDAHIKYKPVKRNTFDFKCFIQEMNALSNEDSEQISSWNTDSYIQGLQGLGLSKTQIGDSN